MQKQKSMVDRMKEDYRENFKELLGLIRTMTLFEIILFLIFAAFATLIIGGIIFS